MSAYELERQAQIAKNKAMLDALNIHEITSKMVPVAKAKPAREKKRKFENEPTEVRRSSRLAGAPPPKQLKTESIDIVSNKVEAPRERRQGDFTLESAATTATKDAHPHIYETLRAISFEKESEEKGEKESEKKQEDMKSKEDKEVKEKKAVLTEKKQKKGESTPPIRESPRLKKANNTPTQSRKERNAGGDSDKENEAPQLSAAKEKKGKEKEKETETEKEVKALQRKKFPPTTKDDSTYSNLQVAALTKTVPERIYNIAIHPSNERIVCAVGDKWGRIGIWDYGTLEQQTNENDLCIYAPHSAPISGLVFSPSDCSKLYSSSYDGSIRCTDIEKGMFLQTYFGDESRNCLDLDPSSPYIIYSGTSDGSLAVIDIRTKTPTNYDIHKRKIWSVSVNPGDPNVLATGSNDQSVCIWDARKISKPTHKFEHKQAVTSAVFSRKTGKFLVSLSYDNHIRIWENFKETHKINHNCNTGRWITPFKVAWDPKSEGIFATGNMSRSLDFFDANTGVRKAQLVDEDLTAIPSINAFHPHFNVVISGTASGRTYLWK